MYNQISPVPDRKFLKMSKLKNDTRKVCQVKIVVSIVPSSHIYWIDFTVVLQRRELYNACDEENYDNVNHTILNLNLALLFVQDVTWVNVYVPKGTWYDYHTVSC